MRTALTSTGSLSGMAQWQVSSSGSLVYAPAPTSVSTFLYDVAVLDPSGKTELSTLPPDAYESPRVSPNGRQIVVGTNDGRHSELWIYDLAGTAPRRQLTFGGRNRFPTWSPDGQHVAFQSDREGDRAIWWQRADTGGNAERLTTPDRGTSHVPESFAPRGDVLSFSVGTGSRYSLWTLSVRDKQTARLGDVESDVPAGSAFSPDGRWIAYQVGDRPQESAVAFGLRLTSFVQPFPATGDKYPIPGSGIGPIWSANGSKIFYTAPPPRYWVVASVTRTPNLAIGNPKDLPTGGLQTFRPDWWRHYDIDRNGRIIGLIPSDKALTPGARRPVEVVLGWTEELRQRVRMQ